MQLSKGCDGSQPESHRTRWRPCRYGDARRCSGHGGSPLNTDSRESCCALLHSPAVRSCTPIAFASVECGPCEGESQRAHHRRRGSRRACASNPLCAPEAARAVAGSGADTPSISSSTEAPAVKGALAPPLFRQTYSSDRRHRRTTGIVSWSVQSAQGGTRGCHPVPVVMLLFS
jgi:hypothetical protein